MRTPKETLAALDGIEAAARVRRDDDANYATAFETIAAEFYIPELVALVRWLQGDLDAAQRERDAYRRAKAENDERFPSERDEARAKFADALTVLRWARISDHPMYGPGVNQGLSTDDEARAALGRIASNLAPHS